MIHKTIWPAAEPAEVDVKYAELVAWGIEHLSPETKDMVYLFENYSRAYLTKAEIENGKNPSKFYRDQLIKIEKIIEKYGAPGI